MIRTTTTLLAVAVMAGAADAKAQESFEGSWWQPAAVSLASHILQTTTQDDDRPWWERRGERDRYEDRARNRGRQQGRRGNGPPFCRNGSGHPVHGRGWCVEKGWAGSRSWARASWEDVIFRGPTSRRDRRVTEPTVVDILGDIVFGRLAEHGRRIGYDGGLDARWVPSEVGSVLQVRMGGAPLAELTDADRNGRVDVVLLHRR